MKHSRPCGPLGTYLVSPSYLSEPHGTSPEDFLEKFSKYPALLKTTKFPKVPERDVALLADKTELLRPVLYGIAFRFF
jgi:hypothetical protein